MAKTLQFRDGSEDGPTGRFLLHVTHEAHRQLAPDQAEGVVAEVRDHLTAQVETQVMNGIARPLAERDAVQGFGSARKFVSGVSHSLYDTRGAERARQVTFAVTTCTLGALFVFHAAFGRSPWASYNAPGTLLLIPLGVLLVGSWLGWRATPKRYALLGLGWAALMMAWTGFDTVTLPPRSDVRVSPWQPTVARDHSRSYVRRAAETAALRRDLARDEVQRLERGMAAFQIPLKSEPLTDPLEIALQNVRMEVFRRPEPTKIADPSRMNPTQLKQYWTKFAERMERARRLESVVKARFDARLAQSPGIAEFRTARGGYVALRTFEKWSGKGPFVSAERWQLPQRGPYQSAADHTREYRAHVEKLAPVQLSSIGQAHRRWRDNGRRWLKARHLELSYQEQALEACRQVAATPPGFNIAAVGRMLWNSPVFLMPLLLIGLNTVPAFFARAARRKYDGWVWRIRSAA